MKLRRVVAAFMVVVFSLPLGFDAAAHTSSKVRCSIVSRTFLGASGDYEYWRVVVRMANKRSHGTTVRMEVLAAGQPIHFQARVPAHSSLEQSRDVTRFAGEGFQGHVEHCHGHS